MAGKGAKEGKTGKDAMPRLFGARAPAPSVATVDSASLSLYWLRPGAGGEAVDVIEDAPFAGVKKTYPSPLVSQCL